MASEDIKASSPQKKNMKRAAVIIIYLIACGFTYGAEFAELASDFQPSSYSECRDDQAFSAGWALIPLTPLIAPFLTGFYQHGFKWTCSKEASR